MAEDFYQIDGRLYIGRRGLLRLAQTQAKARSDTFILGKPVYFGDRAAVVPLYLKSDVESQKLVKRPWWRLWQKKPEASPVLVGVGWAERGTYPIATRTIAKVRAEGDALRQLLKVWESEQ